jgi:hypothetical protein
MLSQKMSVQSGKVAALESEYEKVSEAQGSNSRAAQELEIRLNKERESLGKMSFELVTTEQALADMADESGKTGKETKKLGDESKKSEKDVKTLGDRLKDLGKGTASMLAGVGDKIVGIGKAAGIAIGGMAVAAGAGAIKLGQAVIKGFGDLEQSLGGSEAVFGEFAGRMQAIGEDAYKNMGVTQNQYLETANRMGALFQGSGLDIERSADLSSRAMQRAADMASVMGIDMQTALDSVAGAAKGNFTMMDNLGVAMNATLLKPMQHQRG